MTKFERFLQFFNIETEPQFFEDLYLQSEMTKTYTVLLLLANFIALFGLITNSVAVIIGAMLISPLMGPIISFGFAYITSEKILMRQSLTTIGKSLVYVILSAAVLSFISPLNEMNEQILARTKPNLYDLFIAVFSGLAVAVSYLSKRASSFSIITGVAIATSIIPPLSVVGFGIGTGNWSVSVGSFLLFFTNFTAITATTALSGILFGNQYFQHLKDFNYVKKRLIMIVLLILAICLPLSFTLKQSVENIKIRRIVNSAVGSIKNATVFNVSYSMDKDKLTLNLALASSKPLTHDETLLLRSEIESRLGKKSNINITQVALKEDIISNTRTIVKAEKRIVPEETVKSASDRFLKKTVGIKSGIEKLLAPAEVTDYNVVLKSDGTAVMQLKVIRETPVSPEELTMLSKFVSTNFKYNMTVEAETTVPVIVEEIPEQQPEAEKEPVKKEEPKKLKKK
ncbi:TIGR00341 family protein [Seleniivibrio sp.]|uniref:TIGR00341 family protein n=1 Tax=Seleniivibrio sp. TaxID=2898801 RepID=UPI0025D6D034|nr:TIGR00341 family protein [Seleniivibrio sp.]MCD8553169.1 TIGR00341 family protein [Seleniivibrio sp.]